MSHLKERKEKICLNCGAAIYGRYCHVCGQENLEPKETFWHLVTHFVYDIIHFDGKFFSTLKYLLFWPGHLSHEYLRGRRMSYLHPIKMYVFTSAFFFLIYFSFYNHDTDSVKDLTKKITVADLIAELENEKSEYQKIRAFSHTKNEKTLKRIAIIDSNINLLKRDSTQKDSLIRYQENDFSYFSKHIVTAKTMEEYHTAQNSLPPEKRDGFAERIIAKIAINKRTKYGSNNEGFMKDFTEKMQHRIPQMLFVSLPFFALLLQLLYGRRKDLHYMSHAIFTLHLFCGVFIIILLMLWTHSIFGLFHASMPGFLVFASVVGYLLFWYKSFSNFYEQRRTKTIVKFIFLFFMSAVLFLLIGVVFAIFLLLNM